MLGHPLSFWAVYPRAVVAGSIQANFSATPLVGYFPLTVSFENKSSGAGLAYAWDFKGDGGPTDSTLANPVYIYVSADSYSPQLTIYNTSAGLINTTTIPNYIVVCAPPTAPQGTFTFSPAGGDYPLTVTFEASTSGPLAQIYWDFDNDGSYDAFGSTAQYVYPAAGTYGPRMQLTGLEGFDTEVTNGNVVITSAPFTPSTSMVSWRSWKTRL